MQNIHNYSVLENQNIKYKFLSTNTALTRDIIEKYPDKPWDEYIIFHRFNLPLKLISKYINRDPEYIYSASNENLTLEFISKYINRDLEYIYFGSNENLTLEFISDNLDKLNITELSQNPVITEQFVLENINKSWDWSGLSYNRNISIWFLKTHIPIQSLLSKCICNNPNLTIEYIKSNLNLLDYIELIYNPIITNQVILDNIELPWRFRSLVHKAGITWEVFEALLKKRDADYIFYKKADWIYITQLETVTLDIILANPEYDWHWQSITIKQSITLETIQKYIDKPWDWVRLSSSSKLTDDFLLKNLDKSWDCKALCMNRVITWKSLHLLAYMYSEYISMNPNITCEIIESNPDLNWNYLNLSKYAKITLDFVIKYKHKKWHWNYLSENPNISIATMIANPKYSWNWHRIVTRPDISWDHILYASKIHKLDWNEFSKNPAIFKISPSSIRKYIAAKTIWRAWFRAITNPDYIMCRKRLHSEFHSEFHSELI